MLGNYKSYVAQKVFISGLHFTVEVLLPTLERLHEKLVNYSRVFDFIYIDNRNEKGLLLV